MTDETEEDGAEVVRCSSAGCDALVPLSRLRRSDSSETCSERCAARERKRRSRALGGEAKAARAHPTVSLDCDVCGEPFVRSVEDNTHRLRRHVGCRPLARKMQGVRYLERRERSRRAS